MNLKDIIPVLKTGSTKNDYPHYGKYVNFTDKKAQCYNKDISVNVNFESGFTGSTNIHVLESILKNTKDPEIKQKGDKLLVSEGNFKSSLIIEDIGFPSIEETNTVMLKITDDLLNILKTAIKFTGKGIFSYVLMTKDYIVSTDLSRVFFHEINLDIESSIPVNSKILSVLSNTVGIGIDNNNVVVKNDTVEIVFSVALIQDYPINKIVNFIEESRKGIYKLCNVAPLIDAVNKVSPVQFGETLSNIVLKNDDSNLEFSAESIVNGKCQTDITSDIKGSFSLSMDSAFITGLNYDFDVFVDVNSLDRLYLKNDNGSEIVLLTRR